VCVKKLISYSIQNSGISLHFEIYKHKISILKRLKINVLKDNFLYILIFTHPHTRTHARTHARTHIINFLFII